MIRIEGLAGTGPQHLAVVRRQVSPGQWSEAFFVPVAYLRESAELAYAGNVHVAQGRTVDAGHLVVDGGANRSLVYTGATRGREKNTIGVVTGAPDPAQPSRAEREAWTDAAIRQAAELRRQGDIAGARAVPLRMPDRPSDRQLAPWEAVLAQALQQDEPERTALEEMQATQDYTTNTGHLLELSEAYWRLDVVPQIDEMVRQRLTPREYERYRQDPERPALLQALRAHEIGGRRIEDSLDAITADPMTGLRSIAAGLHGRLGKEPAPARGETRNWAERAPQNAPEPVREATRMLDARQAELGRQLAERPPQWALEAWGVPPAAEESAARRADWEKQAGIVESYREAAGITDPARAIGPAPSGQAQLREAFHSSVVALQLADDQALLRAMGRGELEAAVAAHDRAAALAPREVQAEIGERERELEDAQDRTVSAGYAMDAEAAGEAAARAEAAAQDLARLSVADAARREWAEAHAGTAEAARAAEGELQRRGNAERIPAPAAAGRREADAAAEAGQDQVQPETEAEKTLVQWWREINDPDREPKAEAEKGAAESEVDTEWWAQAERDIAEAAEGGPSLAEWWHQVQNPEPEASAEPEPGAGPEAAEAAVYAEIGEDLAAIGEGIRELADQMEAEADRRAEAQQEAMTRTAVWQQPEVHAEAEAQAEPEDELEAEI